MKSTSIGVNAIIYEIGFSFRKTIKKFLIQHGMNVWVARNTTEIDHIKSKHTIDVVLIELSFEMINVSDMHIFERVRRDDNDIRIVVFASNRDTGMRMFMRSLGVDIYFEMPCNLKEVELSIRNLCAKGKGTLRAPQSSYWLLDLDKWQLIAPNGHSQRLSQSEFVVISRLAFSAGEAVSREKLLEDLGCKLSAGGRSIDVLISDRKSVV